jgi:ubiquinone/menaquinone biosynthesis C-methylase UbiE
VYDRSTAFYDAIYRAVGNDYAADSERVHRIIKANARTTGRRLLDVACGTGRHVEHLKRQYAVEGTDINPSMLEVARQRNPEIAFHLADMAELDLGTTFDAVICLFSSIGYVRTFDKLQRTMRAFARHMAPGGVVIVDGWMTPDRWRVGYLHATLVDEPELKIARISRSEQQGTTSIMEMHHLVVTPDGAESFVERHEMGLFTVEEYRAAFEAAGLAVTYDPAGGYDGRGLYLGVKSA